MRAARNRNTQNMTGATLPQSKQNIKTMSIVGTAIVTGLLILWIAVLGRNATKTVPVVMLKNNVYKNQQITSDMLIPYDMLKGEYNKYATTKADGTTKRKILLWDERNLIIGTYAAYPLKKETCAEYSDFITSRTDNSDSVLYSYPGKDIITLDISSGGLRSFKSYLKPGDRINIIATYEEEVETKVYKDDGTYDTEKTKTYRSEPLFQDIVLADLLNSKGESILDMYEEYDTLSTYRQAQLDASEDWKNKTEPSNIIVALTPEELDRYYFYNSKSNIKFEVSMPQRAQ